jgi:hypothetical protein
MIWGNNLNLGDARGSDLISKVSHGSTGSMT